MLRENVEAHCIKICRDSSPRGRGGECTFAPRGGIVGFIDTSGARDGSRGIAFFGDRMFVNTDGKPREIAYKSIDGLWIISSFEDAFADELSVSADGAEIRISDYSLDKFELKLLLEELCKEQEQVSLRHAAQAERYAELIAQRLAVDARPSYSSPVIEESGTAISETEAYEYGRAALFEHPVIAETVYAIPENYSPAPIPEEKIDWISGTSAPVIGEEPLLKKFDDILDDIIRDGIEEGIDEGVEEKVEEAIKEARVKPRPKLPEVMNGVIDKIPVIGSIKPSKPIVREPAKPSVPETAVVLEEREARSEITESEIRERIESMSPNEVMQFLSETMNEINAINEVTDSSYLVGEAFFDPDAETRILVEDVRSTVSGGEEEPAPDAPPASDNRQKRKRLTIEPIWGDIYIKASQNLRELCESGKLSMEQMETELKERLLGAAEAFENLTSDSSRIPKVMIPKITELKAAAENFDHYFAFGEDIAIRAMFFMLYQMLTYSDRIAESPETKDRLNDFFRRFGSAGITLSMLDMRV